MPDLTLTIVIPEAAVPRIQDAYQRLLGLSTAPTAADIEAALKSRLRSVVRKAEELDALDTVSDPPDLG